MQEQNQFFVNMDKFNIELVGLNFIHLLVFPELQINYSCFPSSISVLLYIMILLSLLMLNHLQLLYNSIQ